MKLLGQGSQLAARWSCIYLLMVSHPKPFLNAFLLLPFLLFLVVIHFTIPVPNLFHNCTEPKTELNDPQDR